MSYREAGGLAAYRNLTNVHKMIAGVKARRIFIVGNKLSCKRLVAVFGDCNGCGIAYLVSESGSDDPIPGRYAVSKMNRTLRLCPAVRALGLLVLCLFAASVASAAVPVIQGRWEFAITSGDTTTQLSTMGQSSISTYLLQSGSTLTNIVYFTSDTILCDPVSQNNVTVANSSVDASGNVSITFTFSFVDQPSFQFVFTGVYTAGAAGAPTTITGTYQRSAGGCTQGNLGTGNPDGTFTATYFPDLAGTWAGAFDANGGQGPLGVPATFTLTTNADKTLSGTVSSPGLMNTNNVACFSSVITLQPVTGAGVSEAAGVAFQLYGTDTNGTEAWVLGWATNPDGSTAAVGEDDPADAPNGTVNDGTNNTFKAYYGISGGPCDGLGGGDAPFQLLTLKKSKHDDHHHDRKEGKS